MEEFFKYDPQAGGSKGIVFIGDKILVYRRDNNTKLYPLHIDLPGGGPEPHETPYETFKREVSEEFGLTINCTNIVYVKKYQSSLDKGKNSYFPVAKLTYSEANNIHFGNEGIEYMLMSLKEFINLKDAWPVLQTRAEEYAYTTS